MRTTALGMGGPVVGAIGLRQGRTAGSHGLGTFGDNAASIAVIHKALDVGMTLIDVAGPSGHGANEGLVGRALAGRNRDRAVLATNVDVQEVQSSLTRRGVWAATIPSGRPKHIRESLNGSLRRLGADHVDLYQLHGFDPSVPLEETWGAMSETVATGKARVIGLTNVTVDQIKRAQVVHAVASVQIELSLWTRDVLTDVLPYCDEQGLAFLARAPLGFGILAGRFASFEHMARDDLRRRLPQFQPNALEANRIAVRRIRQVARRVGATPAQVALAWVLHQGIHVVPMPRMSAPEYVADNATAADIVLDPADLAELDALPAPVAGDH